MQLQRTHSQFGIQHPRCPFCHAEVPKGERPEVCAECHALHHVACYEDHGACSACGARPLTDVTPTLADLTPTQRRPSLTPAQRRPMWHPTPAPTLPGEARWRRIFHPPKPEWHSRPVCEWVGCGKLGRRGGLCTDHSMKIVVWGLLGIALTLGLAILIQVFA